MEYDNKLNNNRHKLVGGIVLFLVVLCISCGLLYYRFIYSRNGIQMLLDMAFDYVETYFINNDSIVGTFDLGMEVNSNNKEVYNILNNLDVNGSYGIDYKNKIMNLDISSKYDNEELIDFNVYADNGRSYLYLNEVYDKYIDISNEEYGSYLDKNISDYKSILSSFMIAFSDSVKEEYFKVEKEFVDGKKLKKTSLALTGDNYQEWINNFIGMLLNDKDFLEDCANVFDLTVEDIKIRLENILEYNYDGFELVIYTNRLKFVKLEVISDDDKVIVSKNNDEYVYDIYNNDVNVISGTVKVISKENNNIILISYYDKDRELDMDITINTFIELNGKVERRDVSNSILVEDINGFDMLVMYGKFIKKGGAVKLIGELPGLIGQIDFGKFVNQI